MLFCSDYLGINDLPADYRSLLSTPRKVEIQQIAGGSYWYHGISKNLKRIFVDVMSDKKISLNFNIDGLPIFKSSKRCFWPILANIHGNIHNIKSE